MHDRVCMVGGMHGGGHVWWGYAWQGVMCGGGQVCVVGGMHGRGMHGGGVSGRYAWQGDHAWQVACMAGCVYGSGCAWQGVCMAGDMHGRGHVWQGACVAWGHA